MYRHMHVRVYFFYLKMWSYYTHRFTLCFSHSVICDGNFFKSGDMVLSCVLLHSVIFTLFNHSTTNRNSLSFTKFFWHKKQWCNKNPCVCIFTYWCICFSGIVSHSGMSGSKDIFNLIHIARLLSKKAIMKHISTSNMLKCPFSLYPTSNRCYCFV